jgi:predicted Fe-S protein YdhL (DUF1289 family)
MEICPLCYAEKDSLQQVDTRGLFGAGPEGLGMYKASAQHNDKQVCRGCGYQVKRILNFLRYEFSQPTLIEMKQEIEEREERDSKGEKGSEEPKVTSKATPAPDKPSSPV